MNKKEIVKGLIEALVRGAFGGFFVVLGYSIISVSWKDAAPAFYNLQFGEIAVWLFIYAFVVGMFGWFFLVAMGWEPESREDKLEKRVEELESKLEEEE